ncbi:MAG: EsaB/YukD family protein [Sporichthyaceae bacterium]
MTATSVVGSAAGAAPPRAAAPDALMRFTVHGPRGRVDLVAPVAATPWVLLAELGPEAAHLVLTRATGARLDPDVSLAGQGVRDGDLLVLADPAALPATPGEPLAGEVDPPALSWYRFLRPGAQVLAPGFAAGAVVALLPRSQPGDDLLAIVAAGVVAAQAAVVVRLVAAPLVRAALTVWLWLGVLAAGVGALVLLGDGEPRLVWCVLALCAVAAAKLLPQIAVDVPDEQLLDAERMSATTWSARVFPPARKVRIRTREVARTVESGRRLLDAGAIAAAMLAAGTAVALALDPGPGWTQWPAYATGALVGIALAACSRAYRGIGARLALRLGGLVAVLAGVGGSFAASSPMALYCAAGGALVLALPVIFAATALGNGWRSVWWARLGDGVDFLAVAGAFPVALLAAGAFTHFRQMLS